MIPASFYRVSSRTPLKTWARTFGNTELASRPVSQAASSKAQAEPAANVNNNNAHEESPSVGGSDIFTAEHLALRETLARIIEKDINPFVDQWEEERKFPAHRVFKKLGDAGLLGLTKPVEFGGMGLDYR